MSKSVTCDNCGRSVRDRPDDTIDWVRVGDNLAGTDDACSINCARALLDQMQQVRWEIDEEEARQPGETPIQAAKRLSRSIDDAQTRLEDVMGEQDASR